MVNIEWYWNKDLDIDHWNRIKSAEIDIHMLTYWEDFDAYMIPQHNQCGYEFEQTPGNSRGNWAWCTAVHGPCEGQNLMNEQQQILSVIN